MGEGARRCSAARLDGQRQRGARGRRRDVLLRARRAGGGRRGAAADRRPRPLRGGRRARGGRRSCAKGDAPSEIGPARCASATASSPGRCSDFIALRGDPSDGLPGAPGIGAKTAAELLRAHGIARAACSPPRPARRAMPARCARARSPALREQRRAAAHVQADRDASARSTCARPPDRATDFAGGAARPAALGMRRLAERLRSWPASGAATA